MRSDHAIRTAISAFAAVSAAAAARAGGDPRGGRAIAIKHCARCHVIPGHDRPGGIGSRTFSLRRPHPAFVPAPGFARWRDAPAYAAEFEVTQDNFGDLVAFVEPLEGG